MTMLERCARAAWEKNRERVAGIGVDLEPWEDTPIDLRGDWTDFARAILDELMNPTPEMIEDGNDATDWGGLAVWQAMLSAAKGATNEG